MELKIMRVEGFSGGVLLCCTPRAAYGASTYTSLRFGPSQYPSRTCAVVSVRKRSAFDGSLICQIIDGLPLKAFSAKIVLLRCEARGRRHNLSSPRSQSRRAAMER